MLSHTSVVVIALLLGLTVLIFGLYHCMKSRATTKKIPVSVNYHLTRQCNYSCGMEVNVPALIL